MRKDIRSTLFTLIIVRRKHDKEKYGVMYIQSNLDYPDLDYPDFSIIQTFSLVPFFS